MDQRKRQAIAWYDRVAATYDEHRLPLSPRVAELVVAHAEIPNGAHVLDVGTGTGNVALAAARQVGARGRVVAIDLSGAMLDEARGRAGDLPIEFQQMDAETLQFADATFDVVASSLLAGPDVVRVLSEMRRVLRPRGRAVFGMYTEQTHQPLADLTWSWMERYGISRPPTRTSPSTKLSESEWLRSRFRRAGFADIEMVLEPYVFVLEDTHDWWVYMRRSTRWGPALDQLSSEALEQLRTGIIQDAEKLRTGVGIQVDGSALIGSGTR